MGLAMPLPSMSGAEPCTLVISHILARPKYLEGHSRLSHVEVVARVDRRDEAERADEGGRTVTGVSFYHDPDRHEAYEMMSP